MRRLLLALTLAAAALSTAACGQRIKFNEAAVEVIEVGSNAGVTEQEITTGRYWAPPLSYRYIVKFPITQQTYAWTGDNAISFINKDRVQTALAVGANIQINPADADNLVRKYQGAITKGGGEDGYVLDDIVNGPVNRELRQAFIEEGVNYTSADLYADGGKTLIQKVKERVSKRFSPDGILIQDLMTQSAPGLPNDIVQTIKNSLLAVETARQKDAELAATVAEGKKIIAKETADSEARRIKAQSISANPAILQLEEIQARGRSLCPINAKICVIGANAPAVLND